MQGYLHQDIENSYTEREIETAKKQKIAENAVPWWDIRDAWEFYLEKSNIFI
ncbi:13107_t:CDS:2 [Funneliformis caledonium]|uniref:13107_t:CDS:1 n=1 Tax=Funneliformis caledonium TaxID=1117310 RepID=A0A9N9ETU7_9GLOM|nr:13107_t:CDS:2 [Funneliformis caledonium]